MGTWSGLGWEVGARPRRRGPLGGPWPLLASGVLLVGLVVLGGAGQDASGSRADQDASATLQRRLRQHQGDASGFEAASTGRDEADAAAAEDGGDTGVTSSAAEEAAAAGRDEPEEEAAADNKGGTGDTSSAAEEAAAAGRDEPEEEAAAGDGSINGDTSSAAEQVRRLGPKVRTARRLYEEAAQRADRLRSELGTAEHERDERASVFFVLRDRLEAAEAQVAARQPSELLLTSVTSPQAFGRGLDLPSRLPAMPILQNVSIGWRVHWSVGWAEAPLWMPSASALIYSTPLLEERRLYWLNFIPVECLAWELLVLVVLNAAVYFTSWRSRGDDYQALLEADEEVQNVKEQGNPVDITEFQSLVLSVDRETAATAAAWGRKPRQAGNPVEPVPPPRPLSRWAVNSGFAVASQGVFLVFVTWLVGAALRDGTLSASTGLPWECWVIFIAFNGIDATVQAAIRGLSEAPGHSLSTFSKVTMMSVPFFSERADTTKDIIFVALCIQQGLTPVAGLGALVLLLVHARLYSRRHLRRALREEHLAIANPTPQLSLFSELLSCDGERIRGALKKAGLKASRPMKQEVALLEDMPQAFLQLFYTMTMQCNSSPFVFFSAFVAVLKVLLLVSLNHWVKRDGSQEELVENMLGAFLPEQRVSAARRLKALGPGAGDEVREAFAAAADDQDQDVKLVAIAALIDFGPGAHGEAIPALVKALASDEDAAVRKASVEAIGKLGAGAHGEAIPALVKALASDKDADVRKASAEALVKLGAGAHGEAIPALVKALASDKDADVRKASVEALVKLGAGAPGEVFPALMQAMASDKNENVREASVVAIGKLGAGAATGIADAQAAEVRGALLRARGDEVQEVRYAAHDALKHFGESS